MVFGFNKKKKPKVQLNSPEVYAALVKEIEEETANPVTTDELIQIDIPNIPCLACGKCTPYCQKCINIPVVIEALKLHGSGRVEEGRNLYINSLAGHGQANNCIGCGFCEAECPQDIHITYWVAYAAHIWEKKPFKPIDGSFNK